MPTRARGRPIIETLTPSQEALLNKLEAYINREGMSPTLRELAGLLGQGVANVYKLMQRLERNGYVGRTQGKSRSLKVLRSSCDKSPVGLVAISLLGIRAYSRPSSSPKS